MSHVPWGVLQRLYDDEPPIKVWREELRLDLATLAARTGIDRDRLARLDVETDAPDEIELGLLAAVLDAPRELLLLQQDDSWDLPAKGELTFANA